MDVQVQNAIEIAWNPTSEASLKSQAFDYLNQLRENPTAWQICLSLFVRDPRVDDVVRHVSLEVVNNAVQSEQLDEHNLIQARDHLMEYIRRHYGSSDNTASTDSVAIQNKIAQTLTFLFRALYQSRWEEFFEDLWQLAQEDSKAGSTGSAGTLLYLRTLAAVHDDIADVLIQNSPEKQKQDSLLKDLVRTRDASRIASSWQEILSGWRQTEKPVVELCLKTVSRWVSWTDINLIVTQSLLNHLFELATQQSANEQKHGHVVQDAAINVFTEIVAKGMQPHEKINLIQYLSIEPLVGQLISSPSLSAAQGTPSYDTDMAETVAKLVNGTAVDIVKVLDKVSIDESLRLQAEELLKAFVPYLLRFFSDEYDEVCSTVIQAVTELLTLLRKFANTKPPLQSPYEAMVSPILDAIIRKMRYDDTSEWGEADSQTDEAEFQELRKRLKILQQNVAATNETKYISTLVELIDSVFARVKTDRAAVNWRDLELAMHEIYILGELAVRNGGLYQKKQPSSIASEKLIRMMSTMVESDLASFPHPSIQLHYADISVRYCSFYQAHPRYIPTVLENFVKFMHSDNLKVRARSWHLFLRYVRTLRTQLGNVSETIVQAIGDLLEVKAEVSNDSNDDDMSSNQNSDPADALFSSQLYLFEAVGCIASASSTAETQLKIAETVITPLSDSIQQHLSAALKGDERAILQIHHVIMALGTLAKGFSDWVPGTSAPPVLAEVNLGFQKVTDNILMALGPLKASSSIRTAARFAFSRMVGVLGVKILEQLPQWIDGFLAENSTKDELATFLKLMDQIVFSFKGQILDVLNQLLTPMLRRVFTGFAEPANGTDDEIQLGELQREYLSFLLVCLGNNLEAVLVSPTNQDNFSAIIETIEHFAKNMKSDGPDAKLALSVLTKMCVVWGGPNIPNPTTNPAAPAPTLPGFDIFMFTRFSALTWTIMTSPTFDPMDPQANRAIGEIAALQQTILTKTGHAYLTYLRDTELRNLGAQTPAIDDYINALITNDVKGFKMFLLRFLQQGRGE